MKSILLSVLLVLSVGTNAQGVIVIGDSLSLPAYAWPKVFEDAGIEVKRLVQNGRQVGEFSLPNDLDSTGGFSTAIYYLGTADMIVDGLYAFQRQFGTHIFTLILKGFDVLVVIPPAYEVLPNNAEYRTHIINYCAFFRLNCVDINDIWDVSRTDTLHPNLEYHQEIGQYIMSALEAS